MKRVHAWLLQLYFVRYITVRYISLVSWPGYINSFIFIYFVIFGYLYIVCKTTYSIQTIFNIHLSPYFCIFGKPLVGKWTNMFVFTMLLWLIELTSAFSDDLAILPAVLRRFSFQAISNALVSVDSFFVIR